MTLLKRQNPQGGPARRNFIAGIVAAATAAAAGLYRFTNLLVTHYSPTPYDDVLAQLVDRAQAVRLGAHVPGTLAPKTLAAQLRPALVHGGLAAAADADVTAARMTEVDGWLLPQSVALLSALASRV
jgi:hypothetical protein